MFHRTLPLITASLITFCFAAQAEASNHQGPYSVELLMNGVSQPVYNHNGQAFVAGAYGHAYQIRVRNHSGRRIEAVVAVDGRDVITGQPVNPRHHRGYLVPAMSSTTIEGFRSSTQTVATFRFSTIPQSYAWRTGTSWGIGTIRVFIFEERPRPVIVAPPGPFGARSPRSSAQGDAEAAPQAMGTSYGEQRWSPVHTTQFLRRTSSPNRYLGLRYNSYQMLAAAGIIAPPPPPVVHYPQPYCQGYCPVVIPGPFAPPPPPPIQPIRIYGY